jgi:hypothetical protein
MQTTNGKLVDHTGLPVGDIEVGKEHTLPKLPPAHIIVKGRVVTRIWANPNYWGGVTWKVDQGLLKSYTADGQGSKSLYYENIRDAVRGLYEAKEWIRRAEVNRSWKRFCPWNWF